MLAYVPFNERVALIKKGEVDSWGVALPSTRVEYPCYIREKSKSERSDAVNSWSEVGTWTVVVEGSAPFVVGDYVEVYGQNLTVKSVGYIKDFDRNIIATKLGV